MEITKLNDFEALLSNEVETTYEQCTEAAKSQLLQPGVEIQLLNQACSVDHRTRERNQ